jgi:hypothetical protein
MRTLTPILAPLALLAAILISSAPSALAQSIRIDGATAPPIVPDGVGDHVALRTALKSIIPANVNVTLGRHIDLEQSTSWNSYGLNWQQTLDQALKPLQLVARYDATKVTISAVPPIAKIWSVAPGTRFRDQITHWLSQANEGGCGGADEPCFRLAEPSQGDGAEPWVITVDDAFQGDFLGALTWLRDGFWKTPRPDIEVTQNNVIVLSALGGAQ